MKLQAPMPVRPGDFDLQILIPLDAAGRGCMAIGIWLFFGVCASAFGASGGDSSADGYGPATSVPVNESITPRAAIPSRNWIDQTQAEANAKSVGCMECHQGVEPM